MAHGAGHEHDVAGTFPEHLVGDTNLAALRIAGLRPADVGRAGRRAGSVVEVGVLTKDPVVELAQLATGLDPELLSEGRAQLPVCA
jgi:hypothetical protein